MRARRAIGYLWASPWTIVATVVGSIAALTGGRVGIHTGVVEIAGGLWGWILPRIGPRAGIAAITIGHCVWAADEEALHWTRSHERVHVAQFERWGPLFPPVYLLASAAAWSRGLDGYLDNHFEREARRLASRPGQGSDRDDPFPAPRRPSASPKGIR